MGAWNDGRVSRSSKINRFGSRNDSQPSMEISSSFHVEIEGLDDIDGENNASKSPQNPPKTVGDKHRRELLHLDPFGGLDSSFQLNMTELAEEYDKALAWTEADKFNDGKSLGEECLTGPQGWKVSLSQSNPAS